MARKVVKYDLLQSHAICFPDLPSCVPIVAIEKEGTSILPVLLWATIKQDEILHSKKQDFTSLEMICKYFLATLRSPIMPDKVRYRSMLAYKLMSINCTYTEELSVEQLKINLP